MSMNLHPRILLRRLRRRMARTEWLVRLLGLPRCEGTAHEPGLIVVQIDGLSRRQLERALARGRMPFLARLLKWRGHELHTLRTCVPSSTPAVQGELFYGVRQAVPSFSFYDREAKRVRRMYEAHSAEMVEKRMEGHEPLLRGGSAYSCIYSGGAEESHWCISELALKNAMHASVSSLLLMLALHLFSAVRSAALMVIELGVAIVDSVRGITGGKDFWKELRFIPARVSICVLLREFITIGAKIDAARGLPIIYLNFLGYDEQAHRRGASSLFAHWTLKGIDSATRRIWRTAQRSTCRDYTLWVISDHGQENTVPYPRAQGESVDEAIERIMEGEISWASKAHQERTGIQLLRAHHLWRKVFRGRSRPSPNGADHGEPPRVVVTAMGPLAQLYLPDPMPQELWDHFARRLVDEAGIPLVLTAEGDAEDRALFWCRRGSGTLPDDAAVALGEDHPYLAEAADELIRVCHHRDAGDFLLSGWRPDGRPISFPMENGSHAGPGPNELGAFAILPDDAPLPRRETEHLRIADLRWAALHHLGRCEYRPPGLHLAPEHERSPLRLTTYNIHGCIGMDGKALPHRIARVLARERPKVVALQEVDVGRMRTGRVNQAQMIAERLGMDWVFHPALEIGDEQYGLAILSAHPMRLVKADRLPGYDRRPRLEPRAALWVEVEIGGEAVQIINVHLGLRRWERQAQCEALLSERWLGHSDCRGPVLLCGDFNSPPGSRVHRLLDRRCRDVQLALDDHRPLRTFTFGHHQPFGRIDHIFTSDEWSVRQVTVPRSDLALMASDHLPLTAALDFNGDRLRAR